jgi:Ran-binding protein 3
MKIRQISQGVEDLTWQNGMKKIAEEEDVPLVVSDTNLATDADAQETEVVTEVTDEDAKGTTDGDAEALSSVADDAATDIVEEEEVEVGDEQPVPVPSSHPEEEPDIGEKEKGVKRKYGARITSGDLLRTGQFTEPLKRPRDDDEKDVNPRETKRPSPPPEPATKPVPVPAPTLKLVCFHLCFFCC